MSFYSVRNPDEKPVHDIFADVKKDPICCCGHALSEHRGHPAMCQKCTCHQFYQFKTKK